MILQTFGEPEIPQGHGRSLSYSPHENQKKEGECPSQGRRFPESELRVRTASGRLTIMYKSSRALGEDNGGDLGKKAPGALRSLWQQGDERHYPVQNHVQDEKRHPEMLLALDVVYCLLGMFAYQMSMYWLNQMYIQKVENPNSNFPRSCRCSSVTKSRSGPALRSQTTSRMMTASPDENIPAKL